MNRRLVWLLCFAIVTVGNATLMGNVFVGYRQDSGELFATSTSLPFTVFEAISDRCMFDPDAITPTLLQPPFDMITPCKIFFLKHPGVADTEFGQVLPPGLSVDDLQIRVTVSAFHHPRAMFFVVDSPLEGDVDGDNVLSSRDIGMLQAGLRDGLLPDLNGDQLRDANDIQYWVKHSANTWFGDANLDGRFDSSDLVQVFDQGRYDQHVNGGRGWYQGDWNSDRKFTSEDLVIAFADGGYERGPRSAAAVPEPNGSAALLLCLFVLVWRNRV